MTMQNLILILTFGISTALSQCVINIDLITYDPVPLIVDRNNNFIYPENGTRTLTIPENGQIALLCHGTVKRSSKIDRTYTPELEADTSYAPLTCSQGNFLYDVNMKVINVYTAVCTARHQPEMAKNYEACSTVGADGRTSGLDQLFLAKIAWNVQGKIYNQIEICADDKVYGSIWVKYLLRGKSIELRDMSTGRPVFRTDTTSENRFFSKTTTTAVTNAYTKANQADMMKKLLGTNNTLYGTNQIIIDTSGGSNYLARGHLAPDANFVTKPEQDGTYYFMNVCPQYQSFNNGNWKSLESTMRIYAMSKRTNIEVYTGTHEILSYPNSNGVLTPIYLLDLSSQLYIPVPKYMWTLMHNPDTHEAILFIGLNNPYAGTNTGLNFCQNVCQNLSWVTKEYNTVEKGAFQCCQIDQALKNKIPSIPVLLDANNNWPTLITTM